MDMNLLIYGMIGLVILYVLIKLLKWPIKLLLNGIVGVVMLYIVNLIGAGFGFHIAINIINALIAGILGIPGVIILIIFQLFV
ncbi:MAG: pro-sigmaK processing inhibitor BofA family protein [Clostridium sp.]|uniref:pro-sigmaK processing inhibitor BofA family protein n=1 Tax=Clostridium sp. TaxID=1506 RepID=UPI003F306B2F